MNKGDEDSSIFEEDNIFFYYNHDYNKLVLDPNRDKVEKKLKINLRKEYFPYYAYIHKVIF